MTKREIDNILYAESGIILLEKESEHSFLTSILSHWVSIISALYIWTKKRKMDFLILTEKRVILIIRNRIYSEQFFIGIESLTYNGIQTSLNGIDQNQEFSFSLNKLRVSYDESKLIKQKLAEFLNRKK